MGIEREYPLGYAISGDSLFRDTGTAEAPSTCIGENRGKQKTRKLSK